LHPITFLRKTCGFRDPIQLKTMMKLKKLKVQWSIKNKIKISKTKNQLRIKLKISKTKDQDEKSAKGSTNNKIEVWIDS
jgi:hypothetical protein